MPPAVGARAQKKEVDLARMRRQERFSHRNAAGIGQLAVLFQDERAGRALATGVGEARTIAPPDGVDDYFLVAAAPAVSRGRRKLVHDNLVPLRSKLIPEPGDLGAWALSPGDGDDLNQHPYIQSAATTRAAARRAARR